VLRIAMIVNMVLVGFSFGGVPLFGFLIGSGQTEKRKQLLRFCLCFVSGLALVMTAAVVIAAKPLVSVITPDASLAADSVPMLRWQVAGSAFGGIVMLLTCLFQASGMAAPAMALSLSRQGILFIAVLLIAVAVFGYQGILVSQCTADILSAALALGLYRVCFRKQGG
jgi:Na+-driven multidrug efflux pump